MAPNPFEFSAAAVVGFTLILMRVAGLFLTSPLFSSKVIPVKMKACWAILVTFLMFPVVPFDPAVLPTTGLGLGLAVTRELFVGFVIGMGAYLLFVGIQLAGQIIDIQMGFGMVNIIDPFTSTQVSVMGQYFYLLALLIFLSVNGHHLMLRGIAESFQWIPLGAAHFTPALAAGMSALFTKVFFIAFSIGAPVIGALFLTNLAMGVIARTVPQMNVFIVGMPLNIAVGMLMVVFSMGFFAYMLQGYFKGLYGDLSLLIHSMR